MLFKMLTFKQFFLVAVVDLVRLVGPHSAQSRFGYNHRHAPAAQAA